MMDPLALRPGTPVKKMTHPGFDESPTFSRSQANGIRTPSATESPYPQIHSRDAGTSLQGPIIKSASGRGTLRCRARGTLVEIVNVIRAIRT